MQTHTCTSLSISHQDLKIVNMFETEREKSDLLCGSETENYVCHIHTHTRLRRPLKVLLSIQG